MNWMRPKTKAEKDQEWADIMATRFEKWQEIYRSTLSHSKHVEIMALCECELETGICPLCKGQWREVDFEKQFGKGRYFEPACECYIRCPNCKRWLYDDQVSGTLKANNMHCTNCGWQLVTDSHRRYGLAYEIDQYQEDVRQQRIDMFKTKKKKAKEDTDED
jgi:hypothetical protein